MEAPIAMYGLTWCRRGAKWHLRAVVPSRAPC